MLDTRRQTAVSPVLGTILLVAITVVVAATVGLGVLSVSERVGEPPPAVVLDTTTDGNSVTVQHRGGGPVETDRLDVRGAQTWTHRDEQLRAGDELTIEPDPNAESVTVVWDDGQRSAILASAVPQAEDQLVGVTRADTYIPVVPYGDDNPTQPQFETLEEIALSDPFTLAVRAPELAGEESNDYVVTAYYDEFEEAPNDRLTGPSEPLVFDENGVANVTIGSAGTDADVTTGIFGPLSGDATLVNQIELPEATDAAAVETDE